MKTALGLLGLMSLLGTLVATSGCEVACTEDEEKRGTTCIAKSLTRYVGDDRQASAEWQAGQSLTIDGVFGKIYVEQGSGTNVEVTFKPFSYRAHDDEGKAAGQADINDAIKTSAVAEGGGVTVSVRREGERVGTASGAEIHLLLPAGFDGALNIRNRGNSSWSGKGEYDVSVKSVGQATRLDVAADSGVSDCVIYAAPTVTSSKVHCGSFVQLENVSDYVDIRTTFGAVTQDAVRLRIASISPGSPGGTVITEDGNIAATFPATGDYSIQAFSPQRGVVNVDPVGHCTINETAPGSKTLNCGAPEGPNYALTAGQDTLGESDINLRIE
jgi:hypothetical protein